MNELYKAYYETLTSYEDSYYLTRKDTWILLLNLALKNKTTAEAFGKALYVYFSDELDSFAFITSSDFTEKYSSYEDYLIGEKQYSVADFVFDVNEFIDSSIGRRFLAFARAINERALINFYKSILNVIFELYMPLQHRYVKEAFEDQ